MSIQKRQLQTTASFIQWFDRCGPPTAQRHSHAEDDDDLEALLKGLDDEPSPAAPAATATPAVDSPPAGRQARGGPGLTREDSHKVAVAKEASESCTSCGKCFEVPQEGEWGCRRWASSKALRVIVRIICTCVQTHTKTGQLVHTRANILKI